MKNQNGIDIFDGDIVKINILRVIPDGNGNMRQEIVEVTGVVYSTYDTRTRNKFVGWVVETPNFLNKRYQIHRSSKISKLSIEEAMLWKLENA